VVPPGKSQELAEAIPGAELVRVAGAGHVVILEQPDLVNSVIAGLLERALPGASQRGRSA
jgi:pimeloyl-ACP methyl ester carboxylesterase